MLLKIKSACVGMVLGLFLFLPVANTQIIVQRNVENQPATARVAPTNLQNIKPRSKQYEYREIWGGKPTDNEKIVGILLRNKNGNNSICSGLWLARDIILTAGHCLCDGIMKVKSAPLVTTSFQAKSGDNGDWVESTGFTIYPGYSCLTKGNESKDLGLVFLAGIGLKSVQIPQKNRTTSIVPRISLHKKNKREVCKNYSLFNDIFSQKDLIRMSPVKMWVAGYGYFGGDAAEVGERREVDLTVNSLSCKETYARWLGCQPFSEFILGAGRQDVGRRDSCSGDSGGPVFIKHDSSSFLPVGVVSRGIPLRGPFRNGSCGAGGIYTHIGSPVVKAWLAKFLVPTQNNVPCG